MSCFVVSDRTVNKVVSAMLPAGHSCEDGENLGRELLAMNNDAVRVRYSNPSGMTTDPDDYEYPGNVNAYSDMAKLKAVNCLIYQCSEGAEIRSRDLYRQLEEISDTLAHNIVGTLKAYQDLPWD